jgi:hypothetical protein
MGSSCWLALVLAAERCVPEPAGVTTLVGVPRLPVHAGDRRGRHQHDVGRSPPHAPLIWEEPFVHLTLTFSVR